MHSHNVTSKLRTHPDFSIQTFPTSRRINMVSNSKSFFTHLPYDIRVIIYDYLEPAEAPPFHPGFSTPAFRLTCHQAQEEIDDKPKQQFAKFIADFEANIPDDIDLTCRPYDLHNITVTIPFSALHTAVGHGQQKNYVGWKEKYRNALHPLFALCFNTIRIHFGTEENKDAPDHETILDRGRVDVSMHTLMRGLVYKIERMNEIDYAKETAGGIDPNAIARPPEQGEITTQARARRICLSWDLRDSKSERDVVLNGKLYQSCNLGRQSYSAEAIARRQRAAEQSSADELSLAVNHDIDLVHYPRTVFYHVRDTQRLVGLMCIQSSRRWAACEEGFYLNEALNAQACTTEYVNCTGLGGHLVRGLATVQEEVFEREEREVEAALWAT
ncbi:hypothetical protein DE146DRAFT_1160 [Phaeosphaeria sp. MPI-PUGE-AT-0046c]|nr:hypothetical protein DE146DRAFT_1160 [Phaeosphaeria sp. MPI-PUGE-AT-0046c]